MSKWVIGELGTGQSGSLPHLVGVLASIETLLARMREVSRDEARLGVLSGTRSGRQRAFGTGYGGDEQTLGAGAVSVQAANAPQPATSGLRYPEGSPRFYFNHFNRWSTWRTS